KIEHVQRVIEGETFEIRRTLRKYSLCLERQRQIIQQRRAALLEGALAPTLLQENDLDLFETLVRQIGEESVRSAERRITLCQIGRCWSDHLAHVAEVREGIHLVSMGGFDAFDEFNREINGAFRDMTRRIDREVLAALRSLRIREGQIDWKAPGMTGPS